MSINNFCRGCFINMVLWDVLRLQKPLQPVCEMGLKKPLVSRQFFLKIEAQCDIIYWWNCLLKSVTYSEGLCFFKVSLIDRLLFATFNLRFKMRRINIAKTSNDPNYCFNRLSRLCILRTRIANDDTGSARCGYDGTR